MQRNINSYKKLIKELLVAFIQNERDINLFIDKLNEVNCFISFGAMSTKQTFPTQVLIKFFNITDDETQEEMYEKISEIIYKAKDSEIRCKVEKILNSYGL